MKMCIVRRGGILMILILPPIAGKYFVFSEKFPSQEYRGFRSNGSLWRKRACPPACPSESKERANINVVRDNCEVDCGGKGRISQRDRTNPGSSCPITSRPLHKYVAASLTPSPICRIRGGEGGALTSNRDGNYGSPVSSQ